MNDRASKKLIADLVNDPIVLRWLRADADIGMIRSYCVRPSSADPEPITMEKMFESITSYGLWRVGEGIHFRFYPKPVSLLSATVRLQPLNFYEGDIIRVTVMANGGARILDIELVNE